MKRRGRTRILVMITGGNVNGFLDTNNVSIFAAIDLTGQARLYADVA
jgi:hypothetical protein